MITIPVLGALLQWLLKRPPSSSLRDLDARTLADIGVDPSEIASIEAEAHGGSPVTRRRIASSTL